MDDGRKVAEAFSGDMMMQARQTIWTTNPERWTGEFEGAALQSGVSIIFTRLDRAGEGAALHRHSYAETFIVRRGTVVFTDGRQRFDAAVGEIVVVPAGMPHGFAAKSDQAEMIDIHASATFITEWLVQETRP